MKAQDIRRQYINFFVNKHGHAEIKGASLIPDNDPTVLFTTAGMHPLVPYLMGETHPAGTRLVDVQKCVRTGDIDEVGDPTHMTFFEMLGNWSLGDYFKEKAIKMSFEFLTSQQTDGGLGLPIERLAVSCFAGDEDAPRDDESFAVWQSLGVPEPRIAFLGKEDNWWGPAGITGPCGPDTEMFYWTGEGDAPEAFDPEDDRWVEIWNDVFMEYNKTAEGEFEPLAQKNVDTGMGLERVTSILQGVQSPYETELFQGVIQWLRNSSSEMEGMDAEAIDRSEKIISDHVRTAVFIIGDPMGVTPSNKDQGYVLRRLIRRAIVHLHQLGVENNGKAVMPELAKIIVDIYQEAYPEIGANSERIQSVLEAEEITFSKTLVKGNREFEKMIEGIEGNEIPGTQAFHLFETYGFPLEIIKENAAAKGLTVDQKGFEEAFKKHQAMSRAGAEQKFSGGLADHSIEVRRLHTATHLLHQALRDVLGDHVAQKGSNITKERLRFDFIHDDKMTPEQIAEVEKIVNEQIGRDLKIGWEEMTVQEAKNQGAIGLFEHKYHEVIKVYNIGDYSKEICGGPHAESTAELGTFKIKKEQSSSKGVRRIKAVIGG